MRKTLNNKLFTENIVRIQIGGLHSGYTYSTFNAEFFYVLSERSIP